MKTVYYAYEILAPGSSDMYVHIDPKELLLAMAKDLRDLEGMLIEGITIGQVKAKDADDALDEIRRSNWLKNDFYGNLQNPEE